MSKIDYVVSMANWNFEDIFESGAVIIKPTDKIDERTIKEKTFETEKEALEFASKCYNERKEQDKDLRWLAYLRVCKCVKETIKELK